MFDCFSFWFVCVAVDCEVYSTLRNLMKNELTNDADDGLQNIFVFSYSRKREGDGICVVLFTVLRLKIIMRNELCG